jgi:hypothetical protein
MPLSKFKHHGGRQWWRSLEWVDRVKENKSGLDKIEGILVPSTHSVKQ